MQLSFLEGRREEITINIQIIHCFKRPYVNMFCFGVSGGHLFVYISINCRLLQEVFKEMFGTKKDAVRKHCEIRSNEMLGSL